MRSKCREQTCYEPADCIHGYCSRHCRKDHTVQSYSWAPAPKTNEPHLSAELEVEFPDNASLKRACGTSLASRDASLPTCSAEFKICARSDRAAVKAAQICHRLWECGGRTSYRCGFHVHIDLRQVPVANIDAFMGWCRHTETAWGKLVPPTRFPSHFVNPLSAGCEPHYYWVNRSHKYPTVEIRLHPGTVNPYKVHAWMSAMKHIQDKLLQPCYVFCQPTSPSFDSQRAAILGVFSDAPKVAIDYLNARWAAGGTLADVVYRSNESYER